MKTFKFSVATHGHIASVLIKYAHGASDGRGLLACLAFAQLNISD
jgi:hypothetical protein